MSRLTKRNADGTAWYNHTAEREVKNGDILEKLAHYEDLEETGRLITLPCKVGDTVWCVTDKHIFVAWVDSFYLTEEDGVLSIEVDLTDVVENDIEIKASSFGRKVFLTKAEAEQNLAELQSFPTLPILHGNVAPASREDAMERLGLRDKLAEIRGV